MSSALWAVVLMKAPVLLLRSAGSDVCNGWLICQLVSVTWGGLTLGVEALQVQPLARLLAESHDNKYPWTKDHLQ